MPWEMRGNVAHFYRNVRRDGAPSKIYYGAGRGAKIAAGITVLRQAERTAAKEAARHEIELLDRLLSLTRDVNEWADLLMSAALFAAGFHRPRRHTWRGWRDAANIIRRCG
jgi:hypothetical protein